MRLRPYQAEAVAGVRSVLARERSTLVVMPTGAGKSLVAAEIMRTSTSRSSAALFLAHRGELLSQIAAKLRACRISPTLEMGEAYAAKHRRVVLASPQTLRGRRLRSFDPRAFDLIVVDEAHRSLAKSYRDILAYFSSAKILGLTASPERADGRSLSEVYASVAYRLHARRAIADGWLAPPSVVRIQLSTLDTAAVPKRGSDLSGPDLASAMLGSTTTHEIAEAIEHNAAGARCLSFHSSVASARAVTHVLNVARPGSARCVDGETPAGERSATIALHAAGGFPYLCNCDVLVEGYDDPAIVVVAVARPTTSRVLLTQTIGRALRAHPGKARAKILSFVGRSFDERLAHPGDVLAGRRLAAEARYAMDRVLSDGDVHDLESVLASAERLDLDHQEALASGVRSWLRSASAILGDVTYAIPVVAESALAVSDATIELLVGAGFEREDIPSTLTERTASEVLSVEDRRRGDGFCSYATGRALTRAGVNPVDLAADRAAELVSVLAAADWEPWALSGQPEAAEYTKAWDAITYRAGDEQPKMPQGPQRSGGDRGDVDVAERGTDLHG